MDLKNEYENLERIESVLGELNLILDDNLQNQKDILSELKSINKQLQKIYRLKRPSFIQRMKNLFNNK